MTDPLLSIYARSTDLTQLRAGLTLMLDRASEALSRRDEARAFAAINDARLLARRLRVLETMQLREHLDRAKARRVRA